MPRLGHGRRGDNDLLAARGASRIRLGRLDFSCAVSRSCACPSDGLDLGLTSALDQLPSAPLRRLPPDPQQSGHW